MKPAPKFTPGQKIDRLTIVSEVGPIKRDRGWLCRCECGVEKVMLGGNLRSGKLKSCGCWNEERKVTHGMSQSHPLYQTWVLMHARCSSPSSDNYKNYGGRGITVCERWSDFALFVADMGERPKGTTLDRERNEEGYCPENCRWATKKTQNRNRRDNIRLTIDGKTQTLVEWAEEKGLSYKMVLGRYREYKWPVEWLFLPKSSRPRSPANQTTERPQ